MLSRARSKDNIATMSSGPSYMTSNEKAKYLHDLRNNRPKRPTGARPPPSSFVSIRDVAGRATPDNSSNSSKSSQHTASSPTDSESSPVEPQEPHFRSTSALSNRISRSNTPNHINDSRGRPVAQPPQRNVSGGTVDSKTSTRSDSVGYTESGKRYMERMEAHNLRKAMENLDMEREKKVFYDAQDEAADLVWKHQNPNAPYTNPEAPYEYTSSSRKDHGRSQSLGGPQDLQRKSSKSKQRYSYAGGTSPLNINAAHIPQVNSSPTLEETSAKTSVSDRTEEISVDGILRHASSQDMIETRKHKRRSSGSKRTPSGSLFRNPEDKIFEEPEEMNVTAKVVPERSQAPAPVPLQARRNPFARVKFAVDQVPRSYTDPMNGSKFDRFEIHKNAPSQSRNAAYMSNKPSSTPPKIAEPEEIKMKDGKEVRGDDIRAATSMRMRDRSPNLPTPSVVSDRPGRPIVSFRQDWKPKEVELKQQSSTEPKKVDIKTGTQPKISAYPPLKTASAPAVPTLSSTPSFQPNQTKESALPAIQTFEKYDHTAPQPSSPTRTGVMPPIPVIFAPDDSTEPRAVSIPNDSLPPALQIGVPSRPVSAPPAANSTPVVSVNEPSQPDSKPKSVAPAPIKQSTRPLPTPTPRQSASTKNFSRGPANTNRSHWSPAGPVRTGIQCAQCALPIAGRIVSAANHRFHPECFTCHHCSEALECVAFYPEPDQHRAERVERIRTRLSGADTPIEWPSAAEDGDEALRFYCHLDYHEFFSPRCKSCKTPIEGEVVVACGAEWHVGHFFCAQCGDPFDASTPFVEKDGYAWCVGCHTQRYSAKCGRCRKPVTDVVVKALGREWHQGCFACVECNGPFDDGRYFLRGESQDPVCVRCEERRLKA